MSDLRAPLLAIVILVPVIASLTAPVALCAALAVGFVAAALRRPGWRQVAHRLAHLEGFLIVLLILLPVTTPGPAHVSFGPIDLSAAGVTLGLQIMARVNAVALLLVALLWDAPQSGIGRALRSLSVPLRFVWLLDLTLRHIDTARDGFRRQAEAMRARGFAPSVGWHMWRTTGHLVGGGLVRALDRARRMDEAMRLRGGGLPDHAPLGPMSSAGRSLVAVAVAIGGGLVALEALT